MNLKTLRSMVRVSLGNPNQESVPDEEIDHYINRAQIMLNKEGAILRKTATASTVADKERYDVPSDCVSILRVDYDGDRMSFIDYDDIVDLDIS